MQWSTLISPFRDWVLSAGAGGNPDTEEQNRFFHYSVFLLLGLPAMLFFSILHFSQGAPYLAAAICISGTSLSIGWWCLWKTGQGWFVYRFNALLYSGLLLYLLSIGGDGGAKILWMYTFPLIALFLLGRKEGFFWNVGLLVGALILLFQEGSRLQTFNYPLGFKLRFVLIYVMISAIALWFEYRRKHYREGMVEKARLLEEEKRLLQEQINQRLRAEQEKDHLIGELQTALEEVQTLRGLLPICSYCHKIRNDDGFWNRIESYLEAHADVQFTHGICPDCRDEHFPGLCSGQNEKTRWKAEL